MNIRSEPEHGRLDPSLSALLNERRQLINLAYRLLGYLADAEDVVQETYARWYAMSKQQREAVESLGDWLTTVALKDRDEHAIADSDRRGQLPRRLVRGLPRTGASQCRGGLGTS